MTTIQFQDSDAREDLPVTDVAAIVNFAAEAARCEDALKAMSASGWILCARIVNVAYNIAARDSKWASKKGKLTLAQLVHSYEAMSAVSALPDFNPVSEASTFLRLSFVTAETGADLERGLIKLLERAMKHGAEASYVKGGEMERKLLRLKLGLNVPSDSE